MRGGGSAEASNGLQHAGGFNMPGSRNLGLRYCSTSVRGLSERPGGHAYDFTTPGFVLVTFLALRLFPIFSFLSFLAPRTPARTTYNKTSWPCQESF